jgi:DNA polymerase sigma
MTITKFNLMTASNINVEDFLKILLNLKKRGVNQINLDMLPDETNPVMNKLIIHPIDMKSPKNSDPVPKKEEEIVDPKINPDNDEIFNLFKGII